MMIVFFMKTSLFPHDAVRIARFRLRQLPTHAENVLLPAFARSNRSIAHARRAHSSKPAAADMMCVPMLRQTDGRACTVPFRGPYSACGQCQ